MMMSFLEGERGAENYFTLVAYDSGAGSTCKKTEHSIASTMRFALFIAVRACVCT
jgi:hypothetical protein